MNLCLKSKKLMIMKKIEINAYSVEEAKAIAKEQGINVTQNVTQSWKNSKSPISGKNLEMFCKDILDKKHLGDVAGAGLLLVVAPGSKDTRERPYKFVNKISEGKRKTKRTVEIRLCETDELVGTADNKNLATKLAKELMSQYRQDMYATIVYKVTEGKDEVFALQYVPSINAKQGTYVVFGIEKSSF